MGAVMPCKSSRIIIKYTLSLVDVGKAGVVTHNICTTGLVKYMLIMIYIVCYNTIHGLCRYLFKNVNVGCVYIYYDHVRI